MKPAFFGYNLKVYSPLICFKIDAKLIICAKKNNINRLRNNFFLTTKIRLP